jgi:hypothetical protein
MNAKEAREIAKKESERLTRDYEAKKENRKSTRMARETEKTAEALKQFWLKAEPEIIKAAKSGHTKVLVEDEFFTKYEYSHEDETDYSSLRWKALVEFMNDPERGFVCEKYHNRYGSGVNTYVRIRWGDIRHEDWLEEEAERNSVYG